MKKRGSNNTNVVIYQAKNGQIEFRGDFKRDTVWGSLNQISELFGRDKSVISRHIKNIFKSQELEPNSVVAKIATTASDGKTYQVDYYNLDVILSVGYRVDSKQATLFRIWATKTLRQHLLEGYTINKKRIALNYERFLRAVGNVFQSFGKQDVYPTVEEKASHLLYFMVKNHPFVDGNKRSGAFAFVWLLRKAGLLRANLTPEALTALTLLVAESPAKEKEKIIGLILLLLQGR